MCQKESQKDNSQKAVLTQIQNQVSEAIIVSSQGEVKSQIQAASQDSQASSYVASQGQVQLQLASFRLKSLRLESQVLRLKSQTQVLRLKDRSKFEMKKTKCASGAFNS